MRVVYDPKQISYKTLVRTFFEIHDPTQADGQGPDRGDQYLSAIFYYDSTQKNIAVEAISELEKMGYSIVTRLLPVSTFWRAEEDHQAYCLKTGGRR